jgi:short-subunit dehydrogenase
MGSPFFECKVVIITGASSGIGCELAYRLAAQGAYLALAGRDMDRLETVGAGCQARGGQALAIPTDVTEPAQCAALVQKTVEEFGHIDILVNNAGISMWANFEDVTDLSIFEKMMRVNYLGSLYCTHAALSHLKRSHGQIVGISSLAGKTGVPARSGYAASKHAVTGFFESLRIELAPTGVSVTLIYPGFVATGGQMRGFGADGRPVGESPVQNQEIMSVEQCVDLMLPAIQKRRRELVMTLRGKLGQWLKLIAPALVDAIARKAIEGGR